MTVQKALASAIKDSGFTQERLAKILEYSGQSSLAQRLRSNITIETLTKIMDAIGYEVTIQRKKPGRRADGQYVLESSKSEEEKQK